MRTILYVIFLSLPLLIKAQTNDTLTNRKQQDSVLQEVTVNAFHSRAVWKTVPSAINQISSHDLIQYAGTSMVPVLNAFPGIRMEERSPASFRLSIRGSLLRSPFGVRNVKVYWNDIPLTDAGGNTYLNLVDLNQLTNAEVIKGPVASMYGAGTGGALLMYTDKTFTLKAKNHFGGGLMGGSDGLFQEKAYWEYTNEHFSSQIQQSHQQADGYREQSASKRDMISWSSKWKTKKQTFQFLGFYTDLYYQTPGGITQAQMILNPKLARQSAGTLPGSVQQQASIYNKTLFGAIHHSVEIDDHFSIRSFVTANHTAFKNPFITNYEYRDETNLGVGSSVVYHQKKGQSDLQWITGFEWLYDHSLISDFGNRSGMPDTVQFKDNIHVQQSFIYSQAEWKWRDKWVFTAGLSLNQQHFKYRRESDPIPTYIKKDINQILTPRFSFLYRIHKDVSFYAIAAKGFSPPALAEIRPSDGNFYGDLGAEYGWNLETGLKGFILHQRLQFDLSVYFFSLQNTIVRRNNAAGAEYFVNAGKTRQNGVEAFLKYAVIKNGRTIRNWNIWSSYSYQPYRFLDYKQGSIDYSGNALTGVTRNIWVSGMEIEMNSRWYGNVSLNATSSLPLTEANDAYADGYQLVQGKIGYRASHQGKQFDLFAGADNLLNQLYSLGNDINAAGKRYYNPAAGRNYFIGFNIRF